VNGYGGVVLSEPAVVVLVGAPGSGKTTYRRRLLADGFEPERVVSLDDLRRELRVRSSEPKPLQAYSYGALQIAAERQRALVDTGRGYLADATNLRRRERVAHVAMAGVLPAYAVLLPDVPLDVLLARNAARAEDEQVPADVIAAFAHRRSLLTRDLLLREGFAGVVEVTDDAATHTD
jgi:predicted kinase